MKVSASGGNPNWMQQTPSVGLLQLVGTVLQQLTQANVKDETRKGAWEGRGHGVLSGSKPMAGNAARSIYNINLLSIILRFSSTELVTAVHCIDRLALH